MILVQKFQKEGEHMKTMSQTTKDIFLAVGIVLLVFAILIGFFIGLPFAQLIRDAYFPRLYSTTDLNDYGKYVGNYNNKSVKEFVTSFFPEEIDKGFIDVEYSYRARKGDSYAFEAYLEFRIEDTSAFKTYIADKTGGNAVDFEYDSDFKEYIISDNFELVDSDDGSASTSIGYARIGKILYSEKEQRIIYVALGVYDGGFADVDYLCVYFNRFGIDPFEYEEGREFVPGRDQFGG